MISLNNLTIEYSGKYIFNDISFNINKNDRIGVIGRNGSGKTTLLKLIYGLEKPHKGSVSKSGDITLGYLPQEGITLSDNLLFEEVKSSLTALNMLEKHIHNITKELDKRNDFNSDYYLVLAQKLSELTHRFEILGGFNIEAEIEKVLRGLGFNRDELWRPTTEFSGGWQMRVELAKILLKRPDCILLDEPTNHLDIDSIQWLETYLKNYDGAVLIVSHDKIFLDNVTKRTIEISSGKIYDMNLNYSDFIKARAEQKEQLQNQYKAQKKEIAQIEKFIDRFRYKATLASRVQSRIKQLEKKEIIEIEEEDNSEIVLKFQDVPRSSSVVLTVKNLSKKYADKEVLNDIHFTLNRGEKVAFVGKNGEGKTTFTKILAGLEKYQGIIEYGMNVQIGYYSQNQADLLNSDDSVFDVIDGAATGEMRTKIRALLGAFLFSGDTIYKKVKVLSGGEKSRLALARLLLEPLNLLLLDEPTNHLDMKAKAVLKDALLKFNGTLIVVSHDRDFLSNLTNKTILFKDKKIKEYLGDINEFLEKYNLENLAQLEKKINSFSKADSNSKPPSGKDKLKREEQKKFQRELTIAKKRIDLLEKEISLLETEIIKLEADFSNPEMINLYELLSEKETQYHTLKIEIEEKYKLWEELHNTIESLQNNQ